MKYLTDEKTSRAAVATNQMRMFPCGIVCCYFCCMFQSFFTTLVFDFIHLKVVVVGGFFFHFLSDGQIVTLMGPPVELAPKKTERHEGYFIVLGMAIPPLIGNPYNGYINPYYWVDDHPLLYGNNGSLDPSTFVVFKCVGCFVTQHAYKEYQHQPRI